ncbi:MAG: ribonuclease P protein component [bacterium]|nr:ribonuclease P protein component [bacterium]
MLMIGSIKKEEDFKKIRRLGRRWSGGFVRLSILAGENEGARSAVVVSKKISNKAVVRNKIRRRVAAILREYILIYEGKPVDILVTVIRNDATYEQLRLEIDKGLIQLLENKR